MVQTYLPEYHRTQGYSYLHPESGHFEEERVVHYDSQSAACYHTEGTEVRLARRYARIRGEIRHKIAEENGLEKFEDTFL